MKIYISADMEGISGITHKKFLSPGAEEYERGRKLMAGDVNAAIEGALLAGAEEIAVSYTHLDVYKRQFYTYAGLCKHCAAVLLTYLEERRTGKAASRILPVSRAAAPSVRTSTYGFDGILGQYVMKDKVNLMQQEILGKVRLEPHFKLTGGSMKAEFRIGNTRMYVLKNIGDFVNAVARNERVSYGRELEFYHHTEAFAPESLSLIHIYEV